LQPIESIPIWARIPAAENADGLIQFHVNLLSASGTFDNSKLLAGSIGRAGKGALFAC
jgi:hypothetical protein